MYLVTAAEMQAMDRKTIESFGIPGMVLMENAGRGATRVLFKTFADLHDKKIGVMAGRGNNGGDGFVVARTRGDAPEVDGVIEIEGCPAETVAGDIVRARINGASDHDLTGQFIP